MLLPGVVLLGIVYGERLDFHRHYGPGFQAATLAALADDKVGTSRTPRPKPFLMF